MEYQKIINLLDNIQNELNDLNLEQNIGLK